MNTTTTHSFARRGTATRTRMVGALVALSLGITGLGLTACGDVTDAGYEKLSSAGANPFTDPVGTDDPSVTQVPGSGGVHPGDTEELYAQDPGAPPCDPAELVAQLQQDPARAKAWAEVLGLVPEEIPSFVESLNPVVLRAATAVTNHSYVDGTYEARPTVLTAGTAVFVNVYGEPTVKCYSGNPLTRGTTGDRGVVVVTPASRVITTSVYANPTTKSPVKLENTPSREALAVAAKSARAAADRAAAQAKAARSEADKAKAALAASNTALADRESKLTTANTALTNAWQQLQAAVNAGRPAFVIAFWQNQVAVRRAQADDGKEERDTAAETVAKAKTESEKLDKAATDAEKTSAQLEKEAREKETAAGVPTPATTPTTPAEKPAEKSGTEKKLQAEEELAPVDAENGDEPADGDEPAGAEPKDEGAEEAAADAAGA